MKRFISVLMAVVMVFTVVCALSGCDALDSLFGEEEPAPDIDINDLYGTWSRELSTGTETYVFNTNMKFSHSKNGSGAMIGNYSVSGAEVTLTTKEDRDPSTHVVRFSEDKNTMIWGNGSVKSEFTRQ